MAGCGDTSYQCCQMEGNGHLFWGMSKKKMWEVKGIGNCQDQLPTAQPAEGSNQPSQSIFPEVMVMPTVNEGQVPWSISATSPPSLSATSVQVESVLLNPEEAFSSHYGPHPQQQGPFRLHCPTQTAPYPSFQDRRSHLPMPVPWMFPYRMAESPMGQLYPPHLHPIPRLQLVPIQILRQIPVQPAPFQERKGLFLYYQPTLASIPLAEGNPNLQAFPVPPVPDNSIVSLLEDVKPNLVQSPPATSGLSATSASKAMKVEDSKAERSFAGEQHSCDENLLVGSDGAKHKEQDAGKVSRKPHGSLAKKASHYPEGITFQKIPIVVLERQEFIETLAAKKQLSSKTPPKPDDSKPSKSIKKRKIMSTEGETLPKNPKMDSNKSRGVPKFPGSPLLSLKSEKKEPCSEKPGDKEGTLPRKKLPQQKQGAKDKAVVVTAIPKAKPLDLKPEKGPSKSVEQGKLKQNAPARGIQGKKKDEKMAAVEPPKTVPKSSLAQHMMESVHVLYPLGKKLPSAPVKRTLPEKRPPGVIAQKPVPPALNFLDRGMGKPLPKIPRLSSSRPAAEPLRSSLPQPTLAKVKPSPPKEVPCPSKPSWPYAGTSTKGTQLRPPEALPSKPPPPAIRKPTLLRPADIEFFATEIPRPKPPPPKPFRTSEDRGRETKASTLHPEPALTVEKIRTLTCRPSSPPARRSDPPPVDPPPSPPYKGDTFIPWRTPPPDLEVSEPITEEDRPARERMKRQAQRERAEAACWGKLGRVRFFREREKEMAIADHYGYP